MQKGGKLNIRKTAAVVPKPAAPEGTQPQPPQPASTKEEDKVEVEIPKKVEKEREKESEDNDEGEVSMTTSGRKVQVLFKSVEEEVKFAESSRLALKSSFHERAKAEFDPTAELQSPLVERNKGGDFFNVRATFGRERISKITFDIPRRRDRKRFRILLVRHGQSLANVDPLLYTRISDHAIPLSMKGIEQARHIGTLIRDFYKNNPYPNDSPHVHFRRVWVSPYKRARETAQYLFETAGDCISDCRESVYLGEQQFGLFEGLAPSEVAKMHPVENEHFNKAIKYGGRFWARMPLGESRYDVAARAERLFERLFIDQERHGIEDVIIVAHGATCRAFAMMWLRRTAEWFENEPNAENCSIRLIEGKNDRRYIFNGFGRDSSETHHKSQMGQKLEKGSSGEVERERKNEDAAIKIALQKEHNIRLTGGQSPRPQTEVPESPKIETLPSVDPKEVEEKIKKAEEELHAQELEWEMERKLEEQKAEEERIQRAEDEKRLMQAQQPVTSTDLQSLMQGGDVMKLILDMKREMDAMKNELDSFKRAFHTTVFVDKSESWRNFLSVASSTKWVTVATRKLSLPVRSNVTINAHGMGLVVEKVETTAALYVSLFINSHVFSKVSGRFGHGTAISHSHSWVPVVAVAALELEPGEHVIELCFTVEGGTVEAGTHVAYNGAVMVTTVYPILLTTYDTIESK